MIGPKRRGRKPFSAAAEWECTERRTDIVRRLTVKTMRNRIRAAKKRKKQAPRKEVPTLFVDTAYSYGR